MHLDIVRYLQARMNVKSARGAALVEYALLLALIAVTCILALTSLGEQGRDKFTALGGSLSAVVSSTPCQISDLPAPVR